MQQEQVPSLTPAGRCGSRWIRGMAASCQRGQNLGGRGGIRFRQVSTPKPQLQNEQQHRAGHGWCRERFTLNAWISSMPAWRWQP